MITLQPSSASKCKHREKVVKTLDKPKVGGQGKWKFSLYHVDAIYFDLVPTKPLGQFQCNRIVRLHGHLRAPLKWSRARALVSRLPSLSRSAYLPVVNTTTSTSCESIIPRVASSLKHISCSSFKMTEEIDASQYAAEESGLGGPGAPTPLSALEVCSIVAASIYQLSNPSL